MQPTLGMIARCTQLMCAVVGLAILAPITAARAQADTTTATATATPTNALCWRPRPAPRCRAYVPTELSYESPYASTSGMIGSFREDDFESRFVMTAGLMKNHGASAALGGVAGFGTDGVLRAEARYRRWIGSAIGVDLGLGVAQMPVYVDTETSTSEVQARGLTAAIGVDFGYFGMDARIDRLHADGRSRNGGFVGAHASAQAGPAVGSVLALAILLAAVAVLGA